MKAIVKAVRIINDDGIREKINLNGVPGNKPTDIEEMRRNVKAYTSCKYVHMEYEER